LEVVAAAWSSWQAMRAESSGKALFVPNGVWAVHGIRNSPISKNTELFLITDGLPSKEVLDFACYNLKACK